MGSYFKLVIHEFQVADIINEALADYFPVGCGVKIIAEPGTYFVESAFTLAVVVHSKRQIRYPDLPDGSVFNFYYIGDGVYTSFDKVLHDPQSVRPIPLKVRGRHIVVY